MLLNHYYYYLLLLSKSQTRFKTIQFDIVTMRIRYRVNRVLMYKVNAYSQGRN